MIKSAASEYQIIFRVFSIPSFLLLRKAEDMKDMIRKAIFFLNVLQILRCSQWSACCFQSSTLRLFVFHNNL